MRLATRLDGIRNNFLEMDIPASVRAALDGHIERLVTDGAPARALAVGQQAPDASFDGVTPARDRVILAAELERGPVVLTWFRGSW